MSNPVSYDISKPEHYALTKYFESLIKEGDYWEQFEEGDEEGDEEGAEEGAEEGERVVDKSEWKFFPNFTKIYELFSSRQRDDKKIYDVKKFLHMYLWDDEGLLSGELCEFSEYYEDEYGVEPSFKLTITWLIGYIKSEKWIV